jgi:hypothetical protein
MKYGSAPAVKRNRGGARIRGSIHRRLKKRAKRTTLKERRLTDEPGMFEGRVMMPDDIERRLKRLEGGKIIWRQLVHDQRAGRPAYL